MGLEHFNHLLNQFTSSELESLLAESPSFQQAHLLLARKYQLENNPKFDAQLQLAALYVQDRNLFYQLFHSEPVALFSSATELTQQTPDYTPVNKEEEKNEHSAITIEQSFAVVEQEKNAEHEPATTTYPLIESSVEPQPVDLHQSHTFDEWLKLLLPDNATVQTQDTAVSNNTPKAQEDELEQMIQANLSVGYMHQMIEEETNYAKGLDQFIEEQKQRHKPEEKTTPVVRNENDIAPEMITETMAKVYEMQKKYSKAIKAYEVLTLKYPEKSDLFAARINYLKNII